MSDEIVHKKTVHAGVHTPKERKEYRKKWMAKKREKERLKKEQNDDRKGGMDATEAPVEQLTDESVVLLHLSGTDKKFEEQNPGYWIYGSEVKSRKCWQCGKSYETQLELNKFCSPKCKTEFLKTFQTMGRAKE